MPKYDVSAFASYRIPLSATTGLTLGGGARYVDGSYNPANTIKTAAYTLVDATAAIDFGKLSIGINATNLFDKRYFTPGRSEEHPSELQSLMRISYAVFCLQKKQTHQN